MSRTTKLHATALTALAAMAATAAVAGPSGAQSTPERVKLDGLRTTVTPSAALGQALAAGGVTLTPVGRASAGAGGSLVFPIVRGRVDPRSLRGRIVHRGGLRLTRSERSLRLRRFLIRTTKRGSVLSAGVGRAACRRALRRGLGGRGLGRRAVQARLGDDRRARAQRVRRGCGRIALARLTNIQRSDSGGLLVATADLTLTPRAARRINRRLGRQVLTGGASVGTATVEAKPGS